MWFVKLAICLMVLIALTTANAIEVTAGSVRPPGGHLPIFYGGDHRGGYPPITSSSVPVSGIVLPAFVVTATPNPFSGTVTIRLASAPREDVRVHIFSPTGRLVRELRANPTATDARGSAGPELHVSWDGRDGEGRPVPAGVYFYRVEAGARLATGRVVLLR